MRKYVFTVCMMVVWFNGCGGDEDDDDGGGQSDRDSFIGTSCTPVISQTCRNNTRYVCKSTGWSSPDSCDDRVTQGCTCLEEQGATVCVDPSGEKCL